jgi:hypothetical protein
MSQTSGEEAAYLAGIRAGRLDTLEKAVEGLAADVSRLKTAHYMLYGAIALVQFLPSIRGAIG